MRSPGKKEPFAIRHFAYDQGFGAVLRYDFSRDVGWGVTLCRFSPDGGKMMIGKGAIIGGGAYELNNCNTHVFFRVADQKDFFRKQSYVGNHMALVYGDYTAELEMLAEALGVEVLKA